MIRAIVALAAFAVADGAAAGDVGSKPQNGACFALADRAARTCLPVRFALIEMEVTDGEIWAHFEDGLATVTIYTYRNETSVSLQLDDRDDVFAKARMGTEITGGGWTLEALGLTGHSEVTVLEARVSDPDMNVYHMEVMTPHDTMHIVVSDFSPEYDDVALDFFKIADEVRYLTSFDPAIRLAPLAELEPVDD